MYRALVSAGETAGLLPNTLDRQAKLLESLAKIKGQIKSALAYPSAIAILTVVIVFIMMLFVIPIFKSSSLILFSIPASRVTSYDLSPNGTNIFLLFTIDCLVKIYKYLVLNTLYISKI